jgi:hypothetical protein
MLVMVEGERIAVERIARQRRLEQHFATEHQRRAQPRRDQHAPVNRPPQQEQRTQPHQGEQRRLAAEDCEAEADPAEPAY